MICCIQKRLCLIHDFGHGEFLVQKEIEYTCNSSPSTSYRELSLGLKLFLELTPRENVVSQRYFPQQNLLTLRKF